MTEPTERKSTRPSPERLLEAVLFGSRWMMAPFYLGLVLALGALLYVFIVELSTEILHLSALNVEGTILMALSLIDLSLAGNLIMIVIFSGYENFVSKIDLDNHRDRPSWMGTIDFSGLKLRLVASIVAISTISLLHAFMKIGDGQTNEVDLKWRVIIHLTFVASGVLLALMDYLSSVAERHRP